MGHLRSAPGTLDSGTAAHMLGRTAKPHRQQFFNCHVCLCVQSWSVMHEYLWPFLKLNLFYFYCNFWYECISG